MYLVALSWGHRVGIFGGGVVLLLLLEPRVNYEISRRAPARVFRSGMSCLILWLLQHSSDCGDHGLSLSIFHSHLSASLFHMGFLWAARDCLIPPDNLCPRGVFTPLAITVIIEKRRFESLILLFVFYLLFPS